MTSTPASPLAEPMAFARGPVMANRFMLAPLTNLQSNADGTASADDLRWLRMRAEGGFGLVMTCAAHVRAEGQGFPGQLGIFSDSHLPGLRQLADAIRAAGSLSAVQLHHAGRRAPAELIGGPPVAPWDDAETGARALSTAEVEEVIAGFVAAAVRAERAGFDGVELHGAHGYLLGQFLDAAHNRRTDGYGGSYDNRARALHAVIDGIRAATGPGFLLGVRLSPERFGILLPEARRLAGALMASGRIDWLDMSLWDVFKKPQDEAFADRPLIDWFTDLSRGTARLGVAGNILDAKTATACREHGADFVLIGRGAILDHDFPRRAIADPGFAATARPVSRAHLAAEGLGGPFQDYLATQWKDFVAG